VPDRKRSSGPKFQVSKNRARSNSPYRPPSRRNKSPKSVRQSRRNKSPRRESARVQPRRRLQDVERIKPENFKGHGHLRASPDQIFRSLPAPPKRINRTRRQVTLIKQKEEKGSKLKSTRRRNSETSPRKKREKRADEKEKEKKKLKTRKRPKSKTNLPESKTVEFRVGESASGEKSAKKETPSNRSNEKNKTASENAELDEYVEEEDLWEQNIQNVQTEEIDLTSTGLLGEKAGKEKSKEEKMKKKSKKDSILRELIKQKGDSPSVKSKNHSKEKAPKKKKKSVAPSLMNETRKKPSKKSVLHNLRASPSPEKDVSSRKRKRSTSDRRLSRETSPGKRQKIEKKEKLGTVMEVSKSTESEPLLNTDIEKSPPIEERDLSAGKLDVEKKKTEEWFANCINL